MTQCIWYGGECPAAVTPRGVVVLEPGCEDLASRLWDLLHSGGDLGSILQMITSSFSADLLSLPSFVAVINEGGSAHVAVRGAFELVVRTGKGPVSLTSGSVVTWSEHRLTDVTGWSVTGPVREVAGEEPPSPWGVQDAMIPVSRVVWQVETEPDTMSFESLPTVVEQEPPVQDIDTALLEDLALPDAADLIDPPAHPEPPALVEPPALTEPHTFAEPPAEVISAPAEKEEVETPAVPSVQEPAPTEPGADFSDLFTDHTIKRTVEDAAVREVRNDENPFTDVEADETAPPRGSTSSEEHPVGSDTAGEGGFFIDGVPPGNSTAQAGDHDGHTVRSTRRDELQAVARAILDQVPTPGVPKVGPSVPAVLCLSGHPNPPHAQTCRLCDAPMSEQTGLVERPNLGVLVVSTGERIALDKDIIIGRRPRSQPQAGRPESHLVPVVSPNQQISRTHCEIRVDGWDVRVRDLGSNNGTFLLRAGQPAARVGETSGMILQVGDVIDLGDSVTARMEE